MAAITSTTSGPRSAGSTWVGGVAPTAGDTAIIANGHNVTVDNAWTIGTGTGAAITSNVGGTLTLGPYEVTCNGDVALAGSIVEAPGYTFTLNGNYNLIFGPGDAGAWIASGSATASNRGLLQAAATYGFCIRATGTGVAARFTPAHTIIRRIGRSDALDEHAITLYSDAKTSNIEPLYCLFDSYWRFRYGIGYTPNADTIWRWTNCAFVNPLHTSVWEYTDSNAFNAGTRGLFSCTFVGTSANHIINLTSAGTSWGNPLLITNLIGDEIGMSNVGGGPVVYDAVQRYVSYAGADLDIYNYRGGAGGWRVHDCVVTATRDNAHIISNSSGSTINNTIEDNITFGGNGNDNHYLYDGGMTFRRNISVGGNGVGTTAAGTQAVVIERHTHINKTGNFDRLGLFETSIYGTNLVTFRSCLHVCINDAAERGIGSISGTVNLAYTDYNDFYNSSTANRYDAITVNALVEGVDTGFGLHDINADPQAANINATVATWDASLGGPGTVAHAYGELLKLNGFDSSGTPATFNAAYTKANALAYFRTNFAPNNIALQAAGYGGEDIGALNYVAPVNNKRLMMMGMG